VGDHDAVGIFRRMHRWLQNPPRKAAMSVKFTCYFPAEKPLFMAIKIDSNAWIVELLEGIAVQLHSRGRTDIKVDDLRLFKVNLSFLWGTAN
jgi:hypothetical protein